MCPKEGQENHLGVCYDKCKDKSVGGGHVTSYKGVGPTCWQEKCPPHKPLKRGLICDEDCRYHGGGPDVGERRELDNGRLYFNRSLVECAACDKGWRRDLGGRGTSCEKGNMNVFSKRFWEGGNWKWKPPKETWTRGQVGLDVYTRDAKGFADSCLRVGGQPNKSLGSVSYTHLTLPTILRV